MVNELELKIKEIIPRTYNVKSFRLEINEDINFKAGQFLSVSLKTGKELTRYLSISSSPTEKGYIEFTKKITKSEFSQTLNKLSAGEWVKIRYPFGAFIFECEYKKIAFLSGGIGITPIRSITRYIVDKKFDTDIGIIYANRTARDIAFKKDFDMMQKEYSKLKVVHILSHPDEGGQGRTGHINGQIIREEIPDYIERKFYVCGPPAMVGVMVKTLLEELSFPKENIVTENFQGY
jgi:ferredoxin-NADP reductase